jgi:pilus assembly protein CpaC
MTPSFFATLLPFPFSSPTGTASMNKRPNRLFPGAIATATALILGAVMLPNMGHAQERDGKQTFTEEDVATPRIKTGAKDSTAARRLSLPTGRSIVVDLPRSAKEVFIGNPGVANAVIRTSRKMYVIAMAEGTTNIFVNDEGGRQIAAFEVNVSKERGNEMAVLRQVLKQTLPEAQIEVQSVGENIILTGEVDSLLEAQRAIELASNLVGTGLVGGGNVAAQSAGAAAGGGSVTAPTVTGKVINGLRVRGNDQVMLKVTIAEVRREAIKELGVDLNGTWKVASFATGDFGVAAALDTVNDLPSEIGGTLRALEDQGVFRTLAEPTLTAVSGESALFNAGGEIPLRSRECDPDTRVCQIVITFKKVGVSLGFTPVVLSGGRISLRVATGVTDEGPNKGAEFGEYIPSFQTRTTETTVEIPSGGSLVTAGLIQSRADMSTKGVPGLMNLPILGTLFKSRSYQRRETELVIMVTPFIVKPTSAKNLPRPTDGFVDASDPAQMFMGQVNRLYGAKGNRPGEGYRPPVGFIAD